MSAISSSVQIRRWQEEVAEDPGAPAYLLLADAYRRDGKLEVAKRLCVRGLERNPEHVAGHYLLGRVYRELGEAEKAHDEWDITLGLDPQHPQARRALGYLCMERLEWGAAVRHLESVAAADPSDRTLLEALELARSRLLSDSPDMDAVDRHQVISSLLTEPLERFTREARVRLTILIDSSGRILAQQGFSPDIDLAGVASLAAGIHAASGRVAEMLGQPQFEQLFQTAGSTQIFLAPIRTPIAELILVSVFDSDTTIGMVRVLFREFAEAVAGIDEWPGREASAGPEALEHELASGLRRALRSVERWTSSLAGRGE